MSDKKLPTIERDDEDRSITSNELDYILDINKKAINIYNEVAQQNEDILEELEELKSTIQNIETNTEETNKSVKKEADTIDSMDKNLLRLVVIFSTIGVGTVIQIIMQLIHK